MWSRDGQHLIVAAVRRPDWEDERLDTELWEFSVADGAARALTGRRGPDSAPAVSPDGKQIAYVGFDDRFQGYQVRRLYVMNRDGGGARVVTGDLDRDVAAPRWSPDGSAIWFLADERGNTGIWRADLRGKVERVAGNVGSSTSAYGGGGAFTIASDGSYAMTYARPDVPGDVAVGRAGARGAQGGHLRQRRPLRRPRRSARSRRSSTSRRRTAARSRAGSSSRPTSTRRSATR